MALPSKYDPKEFEKQTYEESLRQTEEFKANNNSAKVKAGKTYSISMPPPNITAKLHIGHALNNIMQDIIIRFKRHQGYEVLWLPGTDHAALATEVEICKMLAKEGKTKEQLGHAEFMKVVDKWYKDVGSSIEAQMKDLCLSCDFTRMSFTLDKNLTSNVKAAFKSYYDKGLIYKGTRIANHCPTCQTALSDEEATYIPGQATLFYIKYPLADNPSESITIATSRPETMFGDTAVCVNPKDARYKKYIGKDLLLPLTDRKIKVIGDDYVDIKFGTGALKITPAHDEADSVIGLKHGLDIINVIDKFGKLNKECGQFEGIDRFKSRNIICEELKKQGLFVKQENYKNNIRICDRCKTVIEPLITKQWFVKMQELARPAIEAVENGDVKYYPKRFTKHHINWLKGIKDWCISRQIWIGHDIPIYTCEKCSYECCDLNNPVKCPKCSGKLVMEEDKLDTWFSSALWPFSTLGFKYNTKEEDQPQDYKVFYPTSTLITGADIITFWVTKMVYSGLYLTGKKPFENVVINGIVRDIQGRKMSKSLHNGIDPSEVCDEYGVDATRLSLVFGMETGKDFRYAKTMAKEASMFLNKIFNSAKYIRHVEESGMVVLKENKSAVDNWILFEMNQTQVRFAKHMEKFDLGKALKEVYSFAWNKFCDWYIELTKQGAHLQTLRSVFKGILVMLEPFAPNLPAYLYKELKYSDVALCNFEIDDKSFESNIFKEYGKDVKAINNGLKLITEIRAFRKENNLPDNKKVTAVFFPKTAAMAKFLNEFKPSIERLTCLNATVISSIAGEDYDGYIQTQITEADAWFLKADLVDEAKAKEKLLKDLEKAKVDLAYYDNQLSNETFKEKAPKPLVDKAISEQIRLKALVGELSSKI